MFTLLNLLYPAIYMQLSLITKTKKASISRSVETFNYALLTLWACSSIFAAIIPSQITNDSALWIQFGISLIIWVTFRNIGASVTKEDSGRIELE